MEWENACVYAHKELEKDPGQDSPGHTQHKALPRYVTLPSKRPSPGSEMGLRQAHLAEHPCLLRAHQRDPCSKGMREYGGPRIHVFSPAPLHSLLPSKAPIPSC